MKVPQPVQLLFDYFPLVKYPSVPNTTTNSQHDLQQRCHNLRGPWGKPMSFAIGVESVGEVRGKTVPLEPVAFGVALIMCHKNSLLLPRNSSQTEQTSHFDSPLIIVVAPESSPNNQLPLLIETDVKLEKRQLITLGALKRQIDLSLDGMDPSISQIIDNQLGDAYTLCLLCEDLDTPTFYNIHGKMSGIEYADRLHVREGIAARNNFKKRHPNLFEYPSADALRLAYTTAVSHISYTLQLIAQHDGNEILGLKLAGFVLAINSTIPDTQLGQAIPKDVLAKCNEILDQF